MKLKALFQRDATRRRSRGRVVLLTVVAALGVVNALAFAAFTWRKLTEVRRSEARATEVEMRLDASEEALRVSKARQDAVSTGQKDIATFASRYLKPASTELLGTQREVESIAKAAGLKVRSAAYGIDPVKGSGMTRCEIDLPIEGSYRDVVDFIDRIESSHRFFTVDSLTLTRDDAGTKMSLQVSTYFAGEKDYAKSRR